MGDSTCDNMKDVLDEVMDYEPPAVIVPGMNEIFLMMNPTKTTMWMMQETW